MRLHARERLCARGIPNFQHLKLIRRFRPTYTLMRRSTRPPTSRIRGPDQYEDSGKQIVLGLVLPATLLCLVAYNLVTWTVFLTRSRRRLGNLFISYDDNHIVIGIVLLKTAAAIGLFSWFWIANRPSIGRYHAIGLLISGAMMIAGFVSLAMEFGFAQY